MIHPTDYQFPWSLFVKQFCTPDNAEPFWYLSNTGSWCRFRGIRPISSENHYEGIILRVKSYTDQYTSDKFRIHKEPFWVFLRQSDPIKQDILMFRPLESKFVNFTRFPAIFDVYKPYDAIYKRGFAGAFLSDVNQNSYCRLVWHPTCTITPKAGWWTKHAWEIHKVSYVNAIPKSIDDQQISLFTIMGFRMIFTNSMNGIRTACSTRR